MSDVTLWKIQISGYGTFEFTGTEAEANERALEKKRWEGARSLLVWRADLSREVDNVTAEIAALFAKGNGAPNKLFKKRARLLRAANDTLQVHP